MMVIVDAIRSLTKVNFMAQQYRKRDEVRPYFREGVQEGEDVYDEFI